MTEIVNFLTRAFTSNPLTQTGSVSHTDNSNFFAANEGNPFMSSQTGNPFSTYGQNRPVPGGYFAGYYNNKPNIVGRLLFIEV